MYSKPVKSPCMRICSCTGRCQTHQIEDAAVFLYGTAPWKFSSQMKVGPQTSSLSFVAATTSPVVGVITLGQWLMTCLWIIARIISVETERLYRAKRPTACMAEFDIAMTPAPSAIAKSSSTLRPPVAPDATSGPVLMPGRCHGNQGNVVFGHALAFCLWERRCVQYQAR